MAIFYERGTIAVLGEIKSRVSQTTGETYNSCQIVVHVPGPQNSLRPLALEVGNTRINDIMPYKTGDKVEVGFVVCSREWQSRWYTQADLINIKPMASTTSPQIPPAPAEQQGAGEEMPDFLK